MKYILYILFSLFPLFCFSQTPTKYAVVIGSDFITSDVDGVLDTLSLVNLIEPKEYVAILTNDGALNPSIRILKNTLSSDISWVYTTTGIYTGTLAGAFPNNLTIMECQLQDRGSSPRIYVGGRNDDDSVKLYALNSSLSPADPTVSQEVKVTIKVYYP